MKHLYIILISFLLSLGFSQDKAPYADYLKATTSLNGAMITFMIENISDCVIDTITVRVAHNGYYDSYDKDVLIVNLKPSESGQAALNLGQVPSEGWGWTIDSVETSKSDRASCGYTGVVNFEQIPLGGNEPYPKFSTSPIRSEDGSINYPLTRENNNLATNSTPISQVHPKPTVASQAPQAQTQQEAVIISTPAFALDYHYVVKGDTLYSLSKKYNTSVEALMQMNKLSSNELKIGQKLIISLNNLDKTQGSFNNSLLSSYEFKLYAVTKGDTIFSIAKKHNTTVPLIMAANCLNSSSIIKPSSILKIPALGSTVSENCN